MAEPIQTVVCSACNGRGFIHGRMSPAKPCRACAGTGTQRVDLVGRPAGGAPE